MKSIHSRNDKIASRIINHTDFLGKSFKPSLQTVRAFEILFSSFYKDFSQVITIKSVDWYNDTFNVFLEDISTRENLNLLLRDNLGTKNCSGMFCTNNICTGIHYNIGNKTFLKFLLYFTVKGVTWQFVDLLKIMAKDIKAKKEFYQIFWKSERPPFSIIQDWGHEIHKFRFFVKEGIMRNTDQSIELTLPAATLHHSERECQGISPNNKENGFHFFNFPGGFYEHSFDKYYYLDDTQKQKYLGGDRIMNGIGLVSTDLDEEDVVMGKGTDKLLDAIEYIESNIEKSGTKVILFNCCCVPRIIGDDIYSVLKKAKERINIPFVFQGQLEKTPFEQKISLLEEYMNEIDMSAIKKKEKSLSLFGYHENNYQKQLWDILLWNGVKINTSFIPTIDVRILPLMYESELFVFSPNNFQKEIFEYPFKALGTKFITPLYPFSFKYTDAWFDEILKEFGIKYEKNEYITGIQQEYNKKISYVQQKGFTLGVILIGKKEVEKFLDPDYMNNIDVVYFLEEMRFKIHFFIYDDFEGYVGNQDAGFEVSEGNHEDIEKLIRLKSSHSRITFFSKDSDFEEMIQENQVCMIYSDIYFDERVSRLGLNQFSLKNFYVGYEGALDTIKGFITLSEMTFYKNYFRYF